ncbi:hypothetical protein ACF0H5_005607 [Mactra antiquata]
MTQFFQSLAEADNALTEYELSSSCKFILQYRTKNARTVFDVHSFDGTTIKFEDKHGEVPICYDGIPWILIGTEVRECHNGPNRRENNGLMKTMNDHCYTEKKKRRIQVSKKMGCTARVTLRMIIRFPDYKLEDDSKRKRRAVIEKLKSLSDLDRLKKEYLVVMKIRGDHHNHIVGDNAGYGLPLDKRLCQKIKEIVTEENVTNTKEVKARIEHISKSLMATKPSNRRMHPTNQDIRNHVYAALRKNSYSAVNMSLTEVSLSRHCICL